MKILRRLLGISLISFGFDPRRTVDSLKFIGGYFSDIYRWRRLTTPEERRQFPMRLLPALSDRYASSGTASGHYFHQDLWAARLIHQYAPARHVDVGSRIDGFVAHLLCFRSVEVLDIRHLGSGVTGLQFRQADLMSETGLAIEPADSVSCLHALEHFGLGRYGDPVRPNGWRTGMRNLASLTKSGGRLYLGVPVGQPAVEFNAQRIFHPSYIVREAADHGLDLRDYAYVDDVGNFLAVDSDGLDLALASSGELAFGCGLFVFEKRAAAFEMT